MIKLIALLLTITTANANIFPFLLPDEGSHFNHHLQGLIKNSHNKVVIVTPAMNYPSLTKSIIRSLSHGIHLTLIVSKPSGDPLRLIAYEGVNLYSYVPRTITDTLLLVDNAYICHTSGALDEKMMGDAVSNAWCTDDPALIAQAQKSIHKLLQHSSPYLQ